MSAKRNFTKEQVLKAIEGTAGIMSTVASRLQCEWHTAQSYVDKWVCTQEAFKNERERVLDLAESVLIQNIRLMSKVQTESGEIVDTGDAKWMLSRMGKHRGYAERTEVSGPDDGPVVFKFTDNIDV